MLTLANPLGLWALLGIPAVLAIHFLQRQARDLPISTLFLLEKTQRESASGRRFDRLMNSVPLWMQLLAVLLLTWILTEPRYQKARSTQRVAVVLDGSASMAVFKDELRSELAEALPDLQGPAAVLELVLVDSGSQLSRLYSGVSVEEALASLDEWQPTEGLTDPTPAIRIARSLVAREGIVVFATDTPRDGLPFEARLLSVGGPVENVGITGVRFEMKEGAMVWSAVVRNYSDSEVTRTWSLRFPDGTQTEPKSFQLGSGSLVSLQAAFPESRERAILELSPDRFTLDDTVPIVRPAPKRLGLFSATSPEFEKLAERMIHSLENVEPTNDTSDADIALVSYDPLDPALPETNAAVFVNDETKPGAYLKGGIVAEPHPLVEGLNWQSLLVRESIQLERLPTDDVLLWQDSRPLIFLRSLPSSETGPATRQLCFNFDLTKSNATQQPAFIVCLHRFTESVRERKVALVRANLETGQPVELAARPSESEPISIRHFDLEGQPESQRFVPAAEVTRFQAPTSSGFLQASQGETELLNAAVFFGDTREADFKECATESDLDNASAGVVERHTEEDHWWRAWILILLGALLISWYFSKGAQATRDEPETDAV